MRLQVRGQHSGWTTEMRGRSRRRVQLALRRFSPSIGLVTVFIRNCRPARERGWEAGSNQPTTARGQKS